MAADVDDALRDPGDEPVLPATDRRPADELSASSGRGLAGRHDRRGRALRDHSGALQIGGGGPGQSPWYLYEITNLGAVGFFANSNHMGSLLLVAFPFAAMLAARAFVRRRSNRSASPTFVLGAAGCLLIPVGVALNHLLAALALFAPVAFMSFLLFPGGARYQRFVLPAVVLALVATIAVYTSGGFRAELMGCDSSSFATRQDILAHTLRLIGQTFPVGTGLGSFPSVYVLGEDPTTSASPTSIMRTTIIWRSSSRGGSSARSWSPPSLPGGP